MKTRLTIIGISLIIAVYAAHSVSHQEAYNKWTTISAEKMLEKGKDFLNQGQKDSALICFSLITDKATNDKTIKTEIMVNAYICKWQTLFYHFYDYGKSIESLDQAELYCQNDSRIRSQIELYRGITYHTIGIQCSDTSYLRKAFCKYKSAMNKTDLTKADLIISNALELSFVTDNWQSIDFIWMEYQKMYIGKESNVHKYNVMMHRGFDKIFQGEYNEAVAIFNDQISEINTPSYNLRYRLMAYINKARALDRCGNYSQALKCLDYTETLTDSCNVKDAQLEIYKIKSDIYRHAGNREASDRYNIKYLVLKGDILSYKQISNLTEHNFLSQLKSISDDLHKTKTHQQLMQTIICISGIFTLAILILLYILFRKNKSLREKNLKLYNNIEILNKKQAEKYKNSNLDERAKIVLQDKIREVMEENEEIYSCEFSAHRLSEIVGEQYKHISQIINECYGSNFNAYLNGYRVQEACRRMSDQEAWGHLTIEAIAQSVGFKARSSFIKAFKSKTGLTPTEYLKMASQGRKNMA